MYPVPAGKEWIKQTLLGASLLPFSVSFVVFMINFVAIYYKASRAIPFGTMVRSLTVPRPCAARFVGSN